MARKLISLVIPVFNEAGNIPRLLERITAVADGASAYDFEFVFTDNCSTDRTFELLAEYAASEPRIRVYRFSRNFGFQRSILTGFLKARGDAAVQLDADLQDPPELIPEMLEKWQAGYDVVYGIRRKRKESFLLNAGRKFYYWLVNRISDYPVARDAGDFRLISRRVLDVLRQIKGSVPYIRGTIAEIGYPQIGIPYDRDARQEGESKFKLVKLISFGLDGLIHQSTLPLRLSAFFGLAVAAGGIGFVIYLLTRYFTVGANWPEGYATLTILVLLTLMMNAFFFAIIGEYLGRIYRSGKGMPISVIDKVIEAPSADPLSAPTRQAPAQESPLAQSPE